MENIKINELTRLSKLIDGGNIFENILDNEGIFYKYEVIDGLLHFSNSEGQSFIFHKSDKNYSKGLIDTDEIIEQEGCLFL